MTIPPRRCWTVLALLLCAATAQADDGLIGHWQFSAEHVDGEFVADLAGSSPAVISGDAELVEAGQMSAVKLDGDDEAILIADDHTKANVPQKDITAECWVRVDTGQPWGGLVGAIQDNGSYEKGWLLGYSGTKFSFGLNGTGGRDGLTYLQAPEDFRKEKWYHVVGTYDGTTQRLYVDGRRVAESTEQSGPIDYPPQAFYQIGAYHDQDEFFRLNGRLHEARVYNRVLSPEQIKSHHEAKAERFPRPSPLRLPSIFGDHMVLQRGQTLPVWGWSAPGDAITVELAGDKATTTADADGRWRVDLPAMQAGGPHTMTIAGGEHRRTLSDVLIGEVWIGSGQSNMQWDVRASANAQQEIASADRPNIRLFTVANQVTPEPAEDCEGDWQVCTPTTAAGFSAVAYFFGRKLQDELDVPVGLIDSSWGGSPCEAWTARETMATEPMLQWIIDQNRSNPGAAGGMFNKMIHPLIPYGIRGVIWYQGESNVGRADQYDTLFPMMIRDWRRRWDQGDFPFYFVQLAPFNYGGNNGRCAELREAQRKTLSVPATGMVVTTDIGNVGDIHPRNKQEVGRRLALWALKHDYGREDVVYSGPLPAKASRAGAAVRIRFDHVADGLTTRDGEPPNWFELADAEGQFHQAAARIDGPSVVVHADDVERPTAVRFGWDGTAEPNLANSAGLPASPFMLKLE